MAHKELVFRAAAREKVLPVATALADAVRVRAPRRETACAAPAEVT